MERCPIYECHNPRHLILPLGWRKPERNFTSGQTLCVTCFENQFERIPTENAVGALQDMVVLLRDSFEPFMGKTRIRLTDGGLGLNYTPEQELLLPLWRSLLSFHDVFLQLARTLCVSASLHRHIPLYKVILSFFGFLFSLLKEATASVCTTECGAFPVEGNHLDVRDCNVDACGGSSHEALEDTAASLHILMTELTRCICAGVLEGLLQDGNSPAALLLLTDLSDTSPMFLEILSEHCLSHVCALVIPLTEAYRVELAMYLLHQVFESCSGHPAWLEKLASVVGSITSWTPQGSSFLDYLAWALETFRDDESVVVNALCLARFITSYETTRRIILKEDDTGNLFPCITPLKLLRNLTFLLLHPNPDVVVAAAETLQEIIVTTQSFKHCLDIPDYVIESLRTASVNSAVALVQLLNKLPTEMIPAGPTLRVFFELPPVSRQAFVDAVKGPHFVATLTDRLTNLNEVAQQMVCSAQNEHAVPLHCFLLQLRALATACGGAGHGARAILPETLALISNAVLRLVADVCGGAFIEASNNHNGRDDDDDDDDDDDGKGDAAVDWPFGNRLMSLRHETLCTLCDAVSFLLPCSQAALMHLAVEILAEVLRQFLNWSSMPVDGCLGADRTVADALLVLGATVLDHVVGDASTSNMTDGLLKRQVYFLLHSDLLTILLRVPSDSTPLRAQTVHNFMRIAGANCAGIDLVLPESFILDDSTSPQLLLEKSFRCYPYWAASLLFALAIADCPQPVSVEMLDEFFVRQITLLPWFSDEGIRQWTQHHRDNRDGNSYNNTNSNNNGIKINDGDCAIAALTALKICAAYFKWRGELPQGVSIQLDTSSITNRVLCPVPQKDHVLFFKLFDSSQSAWIDALGLCEWGRILLSILASSSIMHMEDSEDITHVKEAHEYIFSNHYHWQNNDPRITLSRLVVVHTTKCGLLLLHLFMATRKMVTLNYPFSCRILSFLCHCVSLAGWERSMPAAMFIRPLLEQHVTPLLLYRETPALAAYVARLVALALGGLPINIASCCDHTLFKWALQYIHRRDTNVFAWQIIYLLIERTHGSEFALRHESELEAGLQIREAVHPVPPLSSSSSVVAALATVRWMVESAMRRRGAGRAIPILSAPVREWRLCASQSCTQRGYIIAAVEYHTREMPPDAHLVEAAPMLFAWVNEVFAQQHTTVAAARLLYALIQHSPQLAASLEALGLFLQLSAVPYNTQRTSHRHRLNTVEERAWVFAALVSAWPPWAHSAGLKVAVDEFLTTLEPSRPENRGVKRPRENDTGGTVAFLQERNVRHAVQALVRACENQSELVGLFPMSRARDFFLRSENTEMENSEAETTCPVVFARVHDDCELFLPC